MSGCLHNEVRQLHQPGATGASAEGKGRLVRDGKEGGAAEEKLKWVYFIFKI